MLAARIYNPYDIRIEDVSNPKIKESWVLIEVEAVGICGTDKAFYTGTYKLFRKPIILGHEICGRVVEIGKGVPKDIIGSRIVTEINVVCGRCWFCNHGLRAHCPYREVLGITIDGGMAEYVAVPYANIHRVSLDPREAIFVEPLAAVLQMIKLAPPTPGDIAAVLGSGTIGLLTLQVLRLLGLYVVVITRKDSPKAKYAKALGANEVLTYEEVLEFIKNQTPEGQGFDYVVEATGNPQGLSIALELVRPRGIIAAKSTHGALTSFDYTKMVVKEVQITASRCGPFKPAIRLLENRLIKVQDLITSRYKLREAKKAFNASLMRNQVKVVLVP